MLDFNKIQIIDTLIKNDIQIISYYTYPSGVRNVILEQVNGVKTEENDFLNIFYQKIIEKLKKHNLPVDNKIVIEFKTITNDGDGHSNLFFSIKDGLYKIGLEAFNAYDTPPIYIENEN
jgi:hypothetical protein